MRLYATLAVCASLAASSAQAQLGRRGGGTRVNVQNRSANVNRNYNANVNRNANINVNRNVNVNVHGGGCYNCGGYYHDSGWNAGSFAAGAAVGIATTAVVAAATRPAPTTTVVVAAPPVGAMVPTLPGGCSTINTGAAVMYQCSNIYYRPHYQGTSLVYQVVTYP